MSPIAIATAAQPGRPRVRSAQPASIGSTYSDSNCAHQAETYQIAG
jgi:hypothetical protein